MSINPRFDLIDGGQWKLNGLKPCIYLRVLSVRQDSLCQAWRSRSKPKALLSSFSLISIPVSGDWSLAFTFTSLHLTQFFRSVLTVVDSRFPSNAPLAIQNYLFWIQIMNIFPRSLSLFDGIVLDSDCNLWQFKYFI